MGFDWKRMLVGSLFLLAVAVIGVQGVRLASFVFTPMRNPNPNGAIIELHKGLGPKDLTRLLISNGVVPPASEREFVLLGRIGRFWHRVKAGEYKFNPSMTPIEVFSVITSGFSIQHPVTVREGENIYEIAADVEAKGLANHEVFLRLCKDPKFIASIGLKDPAVKSLEGYLFPDTYNFTKLMTAEEMIRQMYRHFAALWTPAFDSRAKELGMTRHQIVTLASMIEKETGAPNERPLIGSVFYNRLRKKMKLQSDPTTIYGMWERYDGNIHKQDLLAANGYNTYYVPALPAGPIANPGREAVQAALYPAQSEYLFFVSHNDGTHEFTRSYGEHVEAIRKFQLDPKARQGKSWRDLSKKTANSNKISKLHH